MTKMEEPRTDRRVRKTKKQLRMALTTLMMEKSVGEITVREIAELADVNRGTFYAHYRDVNDLLAQVEPSVAGFLSSAGAVMQGDVLVYRRRKTGTWMTVKVEPEAMRLIELLKTRDAGTGYLFPFIDKTSADAYRQYQSALRAFNGRLKRLGVAIGLSQSLSSYCARHSWATIANYHDYQQELISNAMGHSSVKVTETYFRQHTDERIGRMNHELLFRVFHAPEAGGRTGI